MRAFYNEIDPYAAQWLENLIQAGHINEGFVETRSIEDLRPSHIEGYTQAHFFAGIGGWSYALRLAGWPDQEEVWTGSTPCQPWSQAGRGKGKEDKRHLWPAWFKLIKKCRPRVIFSEQVASPDGLGWFDTVHADLEREGYAVGAADTCAASCGAPHIRQRLYFVAVASSQRREGERMEPGARRAHETESQAARSSKTCVVGRPSRQGSRRNSGTVPRKETQVEREGFQHRRLTHESQSASAARQLGDTGRTRPQIGPGPEERFGAVRVERTSVATPGATAGFWAEADWWLCRDGKARPAKPGAFPLVVGLSRGMARSGPSRVGVLKGVGNAIVPQLAEVFIRAVAPLIGVTLKGRI